VRVIVRRSLLAIFALGVLLPAASVATVASAEKEKKKDPAADINTPRPDARAVSFEVREGTWMSIDVSPDGKTLLFDLLGDIYTLPIAGGNARSLTRGPGYDYHPRFSPDGKTIAFISDRGGMENLWLVDADGKNPRALTSEKDAYVRSAAWTPDGVYLVARKEESKRAGIPPVELWMYHRNGGGGIKLTSSDDLNNASGPVASADGRFIYFSARASRFNYIPDLSRGLWQITRLDRRTGETFPLTTGFGGAVRPALSPDGKTMVFVSRRDNDTVLVARDLDTGAERVLARGVTRDEQEGFAQMDLWPNYAFTPDGASLIFSNQGKIARLELSSRKLAEIPFTARVEQWLAPRVAWQEKVSIGPVAARILRWPGESPDGKSIAFDAFGRVWLQDVEAGKAKGAPRRLTADAPDLAPREYAPALSPDGRWVAYVSWSDAEGGAVWKAPVAAGAPASAPVRLTRRPGHYANPAWSPKGDRLVVIRGSGLELRGQQPEEEEFFEIHWLDAAGGETHYVTSVKLADTLKFHPQAFWNSDGTRIYFRDPVKPEKPTDPPKNNLVSVRLDGTDKKKHLQFPAVGDVVPSPDEQWVAFTSRDNVYVTALPPVQTAKPPEVGLKEGAVPVWRLSDEAGGYVGWADGGKTITWGLANAFHRLPVSTAIAFVEQEKRKAEAKRKEEPKAKKAGGGERGAEAEEELRVPRSQTVEIRLTAPRPAPEGSVVLKGARVITMKGEEVIDRGDVVVTNNRIAAVGPSGKVAVPAGAREFDASGKTIIPGIIDTHAHLHYSGFELFPETKWEYAANLAYGVTTVYDPSAPSLDVFAQAEMVEAGLMIGPRVYSSGDVLYGGQQADIFAEVNDQDDARRQVKRMKAYGARMIKVYQQPRREQRIWFAEACRELKMLLTAEGAGEMNTDLTMVIDGFTAFEHALPVELREDYVQLLAKSKTYYTPTLLVAYGGPWGELYYWQTANPHDDPKLNRFVPHRTLDPLARRHPWITPEEYHFPTVARGAAKVLNEGGNVSLGAHGQLQGLGVHWELWAMAGEGATGRADAMTPMQALRTATILAADKIGFAPDLGSIEPGKLADLVVLEGNPLEDIKTTAKARWVMKNGELYDASTLKQEWPRERALPPFFWRTEEDPPVPAANE
jgi:Tol biopolymer transport system component/imidazolonepropionase-like amidohydrolase